MSTQFTPQQLQAIHAQVKKFNDLLLPAKLRDTKRNGMLLSDYCVSRNWPRTAESLHDAAKIIYATLDWEVPPAKLVLEQSANKPPVIVPTQKLEEERAKVIKKAEIADKQTKENSEFEAASYELISSFLPMTRSGRVDNAKREQVQSALKTHVEKEKARGCSMKAVHGVIAAHIQKEYEKIERASERV